MTHRKQQTLKTIFLIGLGFAIGLVTNDLWDYFTASDKPLEAKAIKQARNIARNLELPAEQEKEVADLIFDMIKDQTSVKKDISNKYEGKNTTEEKQQRKTEMQEQMKDISDKFEERLKLILSQEQYNKRVENKENAKNKRMKGKKFKIKSEG